MVGTRALALGAAITFAAGCGGAANKLVKKGDARLVEGDPAQALADYNAAIVKLRSDNDDVSESLQISREHAATKVGMATLEAAHKLYSSKQYENALDMLWSLHLAGAFGVSWMDNQLIKLMGDIVAKLWTEVENFAVDYQYDLAVLKAEYYVKPFPAGHAHRLRLEALLEEAADYHLGRMRQSQGMEGAAAFHYMMARRFGAARSPDGENALQQLSQWSGPPAVAINHAINGLGAGKLNVVEHYLVIAYQVNGKQLPLEGQEWFGTGYGLGADGFNAIMQGTTLPMEEPFIAIATLPDPDDVDSYRSSRSSGGGGSTWSGKEPFAASILYGGLVSVGFDVNGSALPAVGHTRGFSSKLRFPPSRDTAIEMNLSFETAVIGGDGGGWSVDYRSLKGAESFVFGYGMGYSSQEATTPMVEGGPCQFQRSWHSILFAGTNLTSWLTMNVEWRGNMLRLFGQAEGVAGLDAGDDGHYSPFIGTFSMPIYDKYYLSATVSYAPGAETEAYFGATLNRALVTDLK